MVNKKEYLVIFSLALFIGLIMNISASIYLSQPNSVYNIGDSVDLNVTIDPIVDGPFKLKLVCDGDSADVFSGPPIENLVLPLNRLWINDLKGSCYFLGEYGGEEKKTNPDFTLSDKLNVVLETDSFFAKPNEVIEIKGNVTRVNGMQENGEIEISIPFKGVIISQENTVGTDENVSLTNDETNSTENLTAINQTVNNSESNSTSEDNITTETNTTKTSTTEVVVNQTEVSSDMGKFYGQINNGVFDVSLRLPGNVPAGDYVLLISANDKSLSGHILNQGNISGKLKVPQVLKSISVALSNQIFDPGQNVSIKPSLIDQSGQIIIDSSFVLINDNDGNKHFEKVIAAGDSGLYEIPTDLESAYYTIEVSNGDKKVSKNFFVNEKAKIFFEIRNETLFVKNIGNIRYTKEIQIDISGKPFVKQIDLGIGESKLLYLSGENQSYNVKASDGDNSLNQGNVLLTGHAVDVTDSKAIEMSNIFSNPIIWIFLILIIVIALTLVMNKVIKRKSVARSHDYGKPHHLKLDRVIKKEVKEEKKQPTVIKQRMSYIPIVPPTQAMQGLVTKGTRNNAVIIALKIKNQITPFAKEHIQKSINSIYTKKGAIYEQGEYVIGVLSPLATRSLKNEVDGSKAAEDMCNYLLDYNKKFKEPIEFGIGVNSGEIINEIKEGKLLFTSLGSTLVNAKKLSEYSNKDVLLSESIYHKGMSEVQAERKSFGDMIGFKIRKIVDFEKNKKFIDEFIKRAEKDSSGVKYVRKDGYLSRNRVGDGLPTANTLLKDAQKSSELDINKSSGKDNSTDTNYIDFR